MPLCNEPFLLSLHGLRFISDNKYEISTMVLSGLAAIDGVVMIDPSKHIMEMRAVVFKMFSLIETDASYCKGFAKCSSIENSLKCDSLDLLLISSIHCRFSKLLLV